MRDICPMCSSYTALGAFKCFKCDFRSPVFSSMNFFNRSKEISSEIDIPDSLEFNPKKFHIAALGWLASAYIFEDQIIKHKIAYCKETHRVFIPAINESNVIVFYQLRDLSNKSKNKYLTYGKTTNYTITYENFSNSNYIIVVEDHLSAIRLSSKHNVVCLSGTSITDYALTEIVRKYSKIVFWLDSDLAGKRAMYKNINKLNKIVDRVRLIDFFNAKNNNSNLIIQYVDHDIIVKDPKRYNNSDINFIIKNKVKVYERINN